MDAKAAERMLYEARLAMRLAEGNHEHAVKEWHEAQGARGDNKRWYALTRRHGHGVFQERERYLERVRRERKDAQERLEEAEACYRRVTGKDPADAPSRFPA